MELSDFKRGYHVFRNGQSIISAVEIITYVDVHSFMNEEPNS